MEDAVVDMYEQLPTPFGLVRYGVAPDHPEVKNCQDKFEETAESPRFNFVGNVEVGKQVSLESLKRNYDALLFAYGASKDKMLGIPGEDLTGVYSARAFVGWYNGLPECATLNPRLDIGEDAVIIGQGNVALDVARILLSDLDVLRQTDVTDGAIEALSRSRVKRVSIIGRRGPLQAAFTIKEIRELMHLPFVAFEPFDPALLPDDLTAFPRPRRRIAELLKKGSSNNPSTASRAWTLRFLLSPHSFNSSPTDNAALSSTTLTHNTYDPPSTQFDPSATIASTTSSKTIPSAVAFRSIGYKSAPLPGLAAALGIQFDNRAGIIPNDPWGRVLSYVDRPGELAATHVPGIYCAGWVKRGPTGVIATTMDDAFATADVILRDWREGERFLDGTGLGWEGVAKEETRGVRRVSWEDWKRIDTAERNRGRVRGKEREKFGTTEEMIQVLDS